MHELVVVVQINRGGDEELESLQQIRNAIVAVVALCEVAVETLTVTSIRKTEEEASV